MFLKVNPVSKVMEVKKLLKKGVKGTKIVFEDDEVINFEAYFK